jgi:hypothetical protein
MLKRVFSWFYAATYDLLNGPAERAGLRQQRHDLLAQATGATIEIGAGTGLNLPHYPPAVIRLALFEPDPQMSRRLRRRVARLDRDAEILDTTCDQQGVTASGGIGPRWRAAEGPQIERPMIVGTARRPAGA